MRITKAWLRERKLRLEGFVKDITRLEHRQLKLMVKSAMPNAIIHVDGCPNCGAAREANGEYTCQCSPAERAMAGADQSVMECLKVLLLLKIDEQIPAALVD